MILTPTAASRLLFSQNSSPFNGPTTSEFLGFCIGGIHHGVGVGALLAEAFGGEDDLPCGGLAWFGLDLFDIGQISPQRPGTGVDYVCLKVPHDCIVDVKIQEQTTAEELSLDAEFGRRVFFRPDDGRAERRDIRRVER